MKDKEKKTFFLNFELNISFVRIYGERKCVCNLKKKDKFKKK